MSEVAGFNQFLQTMAQLDFFTLLLPFILSFLLFHFILQKLPLFDDDNGDGLDQDKYSISIALILAFFVAYFLSTQPSYQLIFVDYFGRVSIAVIGLLGLMILLAFAGLRPDNSVPLLSILAVFAIVSAFAISGGFDPFLPEGTLPGLAVTYDDIAHILFDQGIIYLLLIAVAVYWVVREGDEQGDDGHTAKEALDYLLGKHN